jgi:hypothetical protein
LSTIRPIPIGLIVVRSADRSLIRTRGGRIVVDRCASERDPLDRRSAGCRSLSAGQSSG